MLTKEQPHQEKAFEYYYALGEKRTYAKVARKFDVAPSTVKLWGKSFGWKGRVKQRELEIAREMASRTLSDEVNHRERNLQIVQMALVQLARAVADGQVKMTMGDLDKLIRLESFLRDEPDSRHEIVVADLRNKSDEELRQMLREEVRMLKELETKDTEIEEWEQPDKLLEATPGASARDQQSE
jgi:transposase-like protein